MCPPPRRAIDSTIPPAPLPSDPALSDPPSPGGPRRPPPPQPMFPRMLEILAEWACRVAQIPVAPHDAMGAGMHDGTRTPGARRTTSP